MKPFTSISSSSNDPTLLPRSSKGRRNGGCMGRILRRILCINSIQSPPREDDEKDPSAAGESASTPGIVARLMGLESLPFMESIVRTPSLKPRSPHGRYHRITPAYQQLDQDENFFILSFESMDFARRSRSDSGKRKQGLGVEKKKSTRRGSLQRRDEENVRLCVEGMKNSSNLDQTLRTHERERKKNVKRDNLALIKPETEGNSQNSSPNSVLDFMDSGPSPGSAEDTSRLGNSKLRRTLSEELENCRYPKETELSIKKGYGHIRTARSTINQLSRHEKWFETRVLAERETIQSSWVYDEMTGNDHDHFEEIGSEFASHILDQLLSELLINFP